MKEITRRLYTKPVMLGMVLVGVVLLVGLFVRSTSGAAPTFIPAGDDKFETTGNGETYHNFNASKVPAGFFNFDNAGTSHEYSGVVPLVGVPLAGEGDIDTIIHRNDNVSTLPGTTSLKMTKLSLKSIGPITVSYSDRASETWNVFVDLSTFKASTGSMTINPGGTFDSSLKVWPRFTFKRVSDSATKVLDTGDPNGPALTASEATATEFDAEPQPAPTIAPCHTAIDDFEGRVSATASTSCAPVTLTSTNSPWANCATGFCIPRPITEQELLASHNASPPGTKKAIATKAIATAAQ
jgi:hypothetical protein